MPLKSEEKNDMALVSDEDKDDKNFLEQLQTSHCQSILLFNSFQSRVFRASCLLPQPLLHTPQIIDRISVK